MDTEDRTHQLIKSIFLFLSVFSDCWSQWLHKRTFCKVNESMRYVKGERQESSLLLEKTVEKVERADEQG